MKRLALLRHASSSSAEPGMTDFDRPLNDHGRAEARLVGRELDQRRMRFDLVLARTAARVRETVDAVQEAHRFECEVRFEPRIYEAGARSLLDLVRELPDAAASVLLVGHNPGVHELLLDLTDRDHAGLRDRVRATYPAGALAIVELSFDGWPDVRPGGGQIARLVVPPDLAG